MRLSLYGPSGTGYKADSQRQRYRQQVCIRRSKQPPNNYRKRNYEPLDTPLAKIEGKKLSKNEVLLAVKLVEEIKGSKSELAELHKLL